MVQQQQQLISAGKNIYSVSRFQTLQSRFRKHPPPPFRLFLHCCDDDKLICRPITASHCCLVNPKHAHSIWLNHPPSPSPSVRLLTRHNPPVQLPHHLLSSPLSLPLSACYPPRAVGEQTFTRCVFLLRTSGARLLLQGERVDAPPRNCSVVNRAVREYGGNDGCGVCVCV